MSRHKPRNPKQEETKIFGYHACMSVFKERSRDIIKVYLVAERKSDLGDLISWCARNRKAYQIKDEDELRKISGSIHHEGVVILAKEGPAIDLPTVVEKAARNSKATVMVLTGVENPHNLGALIRVAAFFGADAVIVQSRTLLKMPSVARRIGQGGSEIVPVVFEKSEREIISSLREAGFQLIGSSPHARQSIYSAGFKGRVALFFGAENEGMPKFLLDKMDVKITIPGSGAVESLNVAASSAVILSERIRKLNLR